MPGKTIGIMLPVGYEGTQSRTADAIIQNRVASVNIPFGMAVQLVENKNQWELVKTGTTVEQVAGVSVREVVQANTYNPQSDSGYPVETPCDVMVRGNCTVKCRRGTPVAGTAVYVRIEDNSSTYPGTVVGGFEAQQDDAKLFRFLILNGQRALLILTEM